MIIQRNGNVDKLETLNKLMSDSISTYNTTHERIYNNSKKFKHQPKYRNISKLINYSSEISI